MPTVAVPFQDLADRIAKQETELAQLRHELESRRTQLNELTERKQALLAELTQLEQQIDSVGRINILPLDAGAPRQSQKDASTPTPHLVLKPTQGISLPAYLVALIRHANGPVTTAELIDAVVRNRFPTTSSNIRDIVKTRVYDLVKKGQLRRDSEGLIGLAPEAVSNAKPAPALPKISNAAKQEPAAKPALPTTWNSLHEALTAALAESATPMRAKELAERVLKMGYTSKSKDFANVVGASLAKHPNIERVEGKGYRLKKGKK